MIRLLIFWCFLFLAVNYLLDMFFFHVENPIAEPALRREKPDEIILEKSDEIIPEQQDEIILIDPTWVHPAQNNGIAL